LSFRHVTPTGSPVLTKRVFITAQAGRKNTNVAKKNTSTSKPVRQASIPRVFTPDYIAYVAVALPDDFAQKSGEIDPLIVLERLQAVCKGGYRVSVERQPDGNYKATLYGLDTGTAEDDGIGVSAGGFSPLLALIGVLAKLSVFGVLNLHLKAPPTEMRGIW
jgi:hypothetical protein